MKIDIKGKIYTVKFVKDYIILNDEVCEGKTDFDNHTIIISKKTDKFNIKRVIYHELVHAFLFESGLRDYAFNEILVDWIAMNIPNIDISFKNIKDKYKNI